jgi:hypothetical protein
MRQFGHMEHNPHFTFKRECFDKHGITELYLQKRKEDLRDNKYNITKACPS